MNRDKICEMVDTWILEEEIPPRPGLKPVSRFDDLYPNEIEELEAYWDFIRWYLSQDYALLMSIPKSPEDIDFWVFEGDDAISFPFTSVDYQRRHPFDKYAYKIKKIYETVKDLALLHSCISHEEGKKNIHQKFLNLVNDEFRGRIAALLESSRKYPYLVNKAKLFARIAELNGKIQKCKQIWNELAYRE